MPYPKVKLSDNDGNTVAVDTSSNALHVKLAESIDVGMLGDVNIQLADTAVSANDGDADAGTIRVTLANDDTLGGVIYTDDDDWSASSKHVLVGGLYSDSNIVTSGDVAPFRIDLQGAMVIDVANGGVLETYVDDIETKLGAIQTATETLDNIVLIADNQYVNPSMGSLPFAVRNDSLDSLVNTTNDMAPLQVNASGALYVDIADGGQLDTIIDTLETTLTAIETDQAAIEALLTTIDVDTGNTQGYLSNISGATYVDDANWGDGTSKHILVGGVYQSSMQSVTDGDVGPFQIDSNGLLKVALSATDNAVLDAIDSVLDTIKVDTEAIETAVELIGGAIYQDDADFSINNNSGIAVMGFAGENAITSGDVGVIIVDDAGQVRTVNNLGHLDTFVMIDVDNAVEQLSAGDVGVASNCIEMFFQADESNSGYVMVGDSDVADNRGMKLNPGDTLILNVIDTRSIYLWGSAANQNVRCMITKSTL